VRLRRRCGLGWPAGETFLLAENLQHIAIPGGVVRPVSAAPTHPIFDLLCQLGLNGMAKAFGEIEASGEAATLSHRWLAMLLDHEASYRRPPPARPPA
jgi:hypothetical protein